MGAGHPFDVRSYDEVTSTNDLVKQAIAEGAPEGVVVVARAQTKGYGRRGKAWSSGRGGLYMSVLLRPQRAGEELGTLSLVTGIAVQRAVASFLPADEGDIVKIKWPNDVVVMRAGDDRSQFQKICGISLEQKEGALCIGIGVNVRRGEGASDAAPQAPLAEGGGVASASSADLVGGRSKNRPVYLEDLAVGDTPSLDAVRDAVLVALADAYGLWCREGFGALREEFMHHFALEGFKVRIDDTGDDHSVHCEVRDIDERGHLVVLPEKMNSVRKIAAGTITIDA